MLKWFNKCLTIGEEHRQNLTTFSMMGGAMAATAATALLVYVLRYSWPAAVANANAALLMGYLFNIIMGAMGLIAVMVLTQAVIAIGGKLSAEFAGAKFAAEVEKEKIRVDATPPAAE